MKRAFEVRIPRPANDGHSGPGMPEDIIYPLKAYLGELPSYDLTLDWNKQKTEEPSKQHGFAQFYFTRTFELLGVSLGHIFKVEQSDVAMRDVVLDPPYPCREPAGAGKLRRTARGAGQDRRRLVARHDGADARRPPRGGLSGDRRQQATPHLARRPSMSSSTRSPITRRAAWTACSPWAGASTSCSGSVSRKSRGSGHGSGKRPESLFGSANLTIAMRQQDANRTVICAGNNAPYTEAHPYNFTIPSQSATFPVQSGNQVYTNENLLYVFSWATGPTKTAYEEVRRQCSARWQCHLHRDRQQSLWREEPILS